MTHAVHFHGRATARRRRNLDASVDTPVSDSEVDDQGADVHDRADLDADDEAGKPPLWKRLGSLLITLAIVGLSIYLWPARFGGSTRLVIVSGESMEPTYDLGDLVVARDGRQPDVGDVVVFAVPEGEAEGMLVIHRVLEVDDDGFFVTQGDNRDTPDQWKLTDDDIVGEPLLHVPKGALAIRFLQQWWVLMVLLSLLVVFVLWPSSDDDGEHDDERSGGQPDDLDQDQIEVAVAATGARVLSSSTANDPLPTDWADHDPTEDSDRTAPIPVFAEAELLGLPAGIDAVRPRRSTRTIDPDLERIADLDHSLALLGLDVDSWSVEDGNRDEPVDSRAMAEAEAWLDEQLAGVR